MSLNNILKLINGLKSYLIEEKELNEILSKDKYFCSECGTLVPSSANVGELYAENGVINVRCKTCGSKL